MADKKYDVKPSKKAIEEAKDDPYYKKLKEKRAKRMAEAAKRRESESLPEEKEEKESRGDYLKRTNKRYLDMLKNKRIMKALDKMGKNPLSED